MAIVQFFVDNGANIHSKKSSPKRDTVKDLGLGEGEWEAMSDDEKYEMAQDWANEYIEVWWEEK